MLSNTFGRLALVLMSISYAHSTSIPCPATTNQVGLLIPFYVSPTSPYAQTLVSLKKKYTNVPVIAVINPDSGVGPAQDAAYSSLITTLQSASITVLGYIYTSYGQRASSSVIAEVNTWKSWYSTIQGIFLDEMGQVPTYYSALTSYIKNAGMPLVVGNPGAYLDPSYANDVDIINVYENSALPTLSSFSAWAGLNSKMSFMAYNITSLSLNFVQRASKQFNWLFINNANLPNPWESLPPYLEQLMAQLLQINTALST